MSFDSEKSAKPKPITSRWTWAGCPEKTHRRTSNMRTRLVANWLAPAFLPRSAVYARRPANIPQWSRLTSTTRLVVNKLNRKANASPPTPRPPCPKMFWPSSRKIAQLPCPTASWNAGFHSRYQRQRRTTKGTATVTTQRFKSKNASLPPS